MFDDALVKSAILVIDKTAVHDYMNYYDMARDDKLIIPIANLSSKWFFTKNNSNIVKKNTKSTVGNLYFSFINST